MLGWIVFFALMTVLGIAAAARELPQPATASVMTGVVFIVLLVVSLVVRAIRN